MLYVVGHTNGQATKSHMARKVRFYVKDIFGEETMYIADADIQAFVQGMTGNKTLTPGVKKLMEKHGYEFEEIVRRRK